MSESIGIVIPAYHGADVIARCMKSIVDQTCADGACSREDLHVVVVVNDGTDETLQAADEQAAEVRAAGINCQVVASERGRRAALTVGERWLPRGIRVYLDQDARLSPGAICRLRAILGQGGHHRFATLEFRGAGHSRLSRLFHQAWADLPYVRTSPASAGLYAVSAVGRERWSVLPEVQSDDKFVRLLFPPSRRVLIEAEYYEVLTPQGFRELVSARRRYLRGNLELSRSGHVDRSVRSRHIASLVVLRRPRLWPGFVLLSSVFGCAAIAELVDRVRAAR